MTGFNVSLGMRQYLCDKSVHASFRAAFTNDIQNVSCSVRAANWGNKPGARHNTCDGNYRNIYAHFSNPLGGFDAVHVGHIQILCGVRV